MRGRIGVYVLVPALLMGRPFAGVGGAQATAATRTESWASAPAGAGPQPAVPAAASDAEAPSPGPVPAFPAAVNAPWSLSATRFRGPERPVMKWEVRLPNRSSAGRAPIVGPDGTVYLLTRAEKKLLTLDAFEADGRRKWSVKIEDPSGSGNALRYQYLAEPCISSDGTFYLLAGDYLHAISPAGVVLWKARVGASALDDFCANRGPAVDREGRVVVPSGSSLRCVSPTGQEEWELRLPGDIYCTPAFGPDGTIYVGTEPRHLRAVTPDGRLKWSLELAKSRVREVAVGLDGTVYCAPDLGSDVYAVKPDGAVKWRLTAKSGLLGAGSGYGTCPTIAADGSLIAYNEVGRIDRLTPDMRLLGRVGPERLRGQIAGVGDAKYSILRWVDAECAAYFSVVVAERPVGVLGNFIGYEALCAYGPDGELRWVWWPPHGAPQEREPVLGGLRFSLGPDRAVYAVYGEYLYALGDERSAPQGP